MLMRDLKSYLRPADAEHWSAGRQLEALRHYLDGAVVVLSEYHDDDYQGDMYAVLTDREHFWLWRDSFGTCSGCDGLQDSNGQEYIAATLAEGNTRRFESLQEAREYLATTEDYWWTRFPADLIQDAETKTARAASGASSDAAPETPDRQA
jgi:hypothetical protein